MNKVPLDASSFFAYQYLNENNRDIIILTNDNDEISNVYNFLKFINQDINIKILSFPDFDTNPYDIVSPSSHILLQRAKVLSDLSSSLNQNNTLLIASLAGLLRKIPNIENFKDEALILYEGMKISIAELSHYLVDNGFNRNFTAVDFKEFAVRGEIVDIILLQSAYRINFNNDVIESIKVLDKENQISINKVKEIILYPASEVMLNSKTISTFRSNYLLKFGINNTNHQLFHAITEKRKFPAYENLISLFYDKLTCITSYLNDPVIIYNQFHLSNIQETINSINNAYNLRVDSIKALGFSPILTPDTTYFNDSQIQEILKSGINLSDYDSSTNNIYHINKLLDNTTKIINTAIDDDIQSTDIIRVNNYIKQKLSYIIQNNKEKNIIILYSLQSNAEKIQNMLKALNYKYHNIKNLSEAKIDTINLTNIHLNAGFYNTEYLFIAEQDLHLKSINKKSSIINSRNKLQNILTELDALEVGEYIVHIDYGIGKFLGIETIDVRGNLHDCLKLLYANDDKLYIPVEKINLVKKYGNFEVELDKLGQVSWQKRKLKLKSNINEIAEKLVAITAKRKLLEVKSVEYPLEEYDKFCKIFEYVETEDQLTAIQNIQDDLSNNYLMDRLICGDVGFGKTEVAMRSAFMVATNTNTYKAQIVVVVPTTILCKQHYIRFSERFKPFGIKVAQLSRLLSVKESKLVKEQIANGDFQIIIATHAIFSDVKFHNLQLIIIDEEQHFGVKQKEHLKEIKSSVHVLSLSATPIPRTLQMSMLGLKDLSIISTPPINRLAIHTRVVQFDDLLIRDALMQEYDRGGKSFYVCPRISDLEDIEVLLTRIVPKLKYKIAHGKMTPNKVDTIMEEFYNGQFDILLSTTIIQSGIDIASANTLIVHKAETLGLSQLYQLRGRIGRSNTRGYAYLVTTPKKIINNIAIKKLGIIENIDSLGGGFVIASHDMDIRGFGNLIGEEQSGNVKEVGIELYQEMLDQQINILKDSNDNNKTEDYIPSVNLPIPVFIPNDYISDPTLKLSIYKRIAALKNDQEIENLYLELIDRFGNVPNEVENLFHTVKIQNLCKKLNIESIDCGDNGFLLKFKDIDNAHEIAMKIASKYPKESKIKPNNKLAIVKKLDKNNVLHNIFEILNIVKVQL